MKWNIKISMKKDSVSSVSPDRPTTLILFRKKNALGSLEKTSTSFWIWFDMVDFRMFFHDNFSDLRKFALKWKNLTEIWGIFDEFLGQIFFDEFWGWIYVKKLSRVIWFRFPVDFQNFDECIDCIASVFFLAGNLKMVKWGGCAGELFRIYAMTWLNDFRVLMVSFRGFQVGKRRDDVFSSQLFLVDRRYCR